MGLDMYAWRVAKEDAIGDFEIAKNDEGQAKIEEVFYWRKHHDLHGWMENLYRFKGGPAASFNCIPVRLTEVNLDALQHDLMNGTLPETQGFFFGTNPPDDESLKRDLEFIQMARDIIAAGDAVYYDSWW